MNLWVAITSAVFLGLVTGLHCAGMCGGLILAVGGAFDLDKTEVSLKRGWGPHLAYHIGRAITYASLGAAVGAAGVVIERLGALAGLYHLTMMVSMAILAGAGLHLTGLMPVAGKGEGGGLVDWLGRILRGVSGIPGAFTLGALTGFLPCGPLYGALALAVATQSPVVGAAAMLSFWAGTLPVLLGLGHSGRLLASKVRGKAGVAIALMIVGVAICIMAMKLMGSIHPAPGGAQAGSNTCPEHAEHVINLK